MVKKKRKKASTWSDVKKVLVNLNQHQLLKVIADLYRLSGENSAFLNTRYAAGDSPIIPYKKIIEECMYPDIYSNKSIQISKAKKAISNYSKAVNDPEGEAELMTYFVECGNSFTVNFGDIDGPFYDALNRMYRRAISKVLTLSEKQQKKFKDRLSVIKNSSSNIGWGYHDTLWVDYYEAFPEDE